MVAAVMVVLVTATVTEEETMVIVTKANSGEIEVFYHEELFICHCYWVSSQHISQL